MASMESICARLCLLSRAGKRINAPLLSRAAVSRMVSRGAIEGLVLRSVPGIAEEHYERAKLLLSQSAHVYAKLERYYMLGYEVLLPEDELWPRKLEVLGLQMPQFLFVRGNISLLSKRSVAIAGSRSVAPETKDVAKQCAGAIADAGLTLICGGANGVDESAQCGVLDAGGGVILVPAVAARELMEKRAIQHAFERQQLLLCCETWPDTPFSAHKALERNHTIYALGDAALVIAARNGMGGSWQGAIDCLHGKYAPLYAVSMDHEDMAGNRVLIERGAKEYDPSKPMLDQMF